MAIVRNNKPKFRPLELNENRIKQIFNTCVATQNSQHLLPIELKLSDSKNVITFDHDVLDKELKNIQYIIGQLKVVHEKPRVVNFDYLRYKYDGSEIFDKRDKVTPIQLLALGLTVAATTKLLDNNDIGVLTSLKTLSPYDPAFPAWWEEHKSEWGPDSY